MTATEKRALKGLASDILINAGVTGVYVSDSATLTVLVKDSPENRDLLRSILGSLEQVSVGKGQLFLSGQKLLLGLINDIKPWTPPK